MTDIPKKQTKKESRRDARRFLFCSSGSDRPRDLAGTQTPGAYIYVTGGTVHNGLDPLDVRLPHPVGTAVGVGYLDSECYALVAKFTLCHVRASFAYV